MSENENKNPLDGFSWGFVENAVSTVRDGDFQQVCGVFAQLVETNDFDELKDNPLLHLLAHKIYLLCANNAPESLTFETVMASDSEFFREIDPEICKEQVGAWLKANKL